METTQITEPLYASSKSSVIMAKNCKKLKPLNKNLLLEESSSLWKEKTCFQHKFFVSGTAPSYAKYGGNSTWLIWPKNNEKNPKKLKFDFTSCTHLPKSSFGPLLLSLPLNSTKSLRNLTIIFNGCSKIKGDALMLLFSLLKQINTLKKVELDLQNCTKMTYSGITSLSTFFRNQKSLQTLTLNFSLTYWRSFTVNSLLFGNYTTTNLFGNYTISSLISPSIGAEVNSADYFRLDDSGLSLLSISLSNLKFLTQLTLNLMGTKITDIGLKALSASLTKLKSLRNIALLLCPCAITDLGLISLATAFTKLESLNWIILELAYCVQLTNTGIISLSSSLQEMKRLMYLNLSFYGCKITRTSVEALDSAFKNMKNLKSLVLDLDRCEKYVSPYSLMTSSVFDANQNEKNLLEESVQHIPLKNIRDPGNMKKNPFLS